MQTTYNNLLNKIILRKQIAVEKAKEKISPIRMRQLAEESPSPVPFFNRFRKDSVNIIAELKKASPSKGLIRPDLNCAQTALEYERCGAVAISVLTESDYFHGSSDDLTAVTQTVSLPILRKDFIFDPYQIDESTVFGASAILLIAALLTPDRLNYLALYALQNGLTVLGEAHNRQEIKILLDSPVSAIGVNARDLKTFQTSLQTVEELLPLIPENRVPIAESSIQTRNDILRLNQCGAIGFLVGETLMRAEVPGNKLLELRGNKQKDIHNLNNN